MAGDATVHILDPREAGFCPTVFLQGLKKRTAALVWGGESRAPQDSCLCSGPEHPSQGVRGVLLAFMEAEGQIILRVQCLAAPKSLVPVGCALSPPSGVNLGEKLLLPFRE